ncbi:hypothetical protein Q3G72_005114 [Acer saccharum]|nr:hypothetical protein Q3G72_005114 [Acer saccharum]
MDGANFWSGSSEFEQINNDDAKLEAKEVARLVPKIMKRKLNSDDDSDSDSTRFDDDAYSKQTEDDSSVGYVNAEHEDYHDNAIKN